MKKLKSYYLNLNERDRRVLLFGGAALIFYLFYLFIYSPIVNDIEKNSAKLTENKKTLAWMERAKLHKNTAPAKNNISKSQLLSTVASELRTNTLKSYPYKLEQTAAGEMQLSFEQVPFIAYINWLKRLSSRNNVIIKQLNIEKTNTNGVVRSFVIISAK
jgi:general secretion pathway protein M